MKYFNILAMLLLVSVLSFNACKDSADSNKQENKEPLELKDSPTFPTATTPITATPDKPLPSAQNSKGVWHYNCKNGCAGGAGKAGNCTVCGDPLAHNTAYHAKPDNTTNIINNNIPGATQTSPLANPPLAEPAQNATGVWHFTCGKGCAGGAGALGTCATCGGPLAHNKTYHK